MTIKLITLDGLTLAHEITGDGQNVLLLPGWRQPIESMQPVATRLAPHGYRTHTIDFPGFGRSPLPPGAWGVADYARLVTLYMDHFNLSPACVVGHSFGGRIGIVLGADYPGHVAQLVLADSAGVITPPTPAQQRRKRAFDTFYALPLSDSFKTRVRAWARDRYGSDDLKAAGPLEPIFRAVVAEDLLPRAAHIKAPTLLIWGDKDDQTPLWQGKLLEKTIPDAGLVVFEGGGHFA
ncbi:MAG TPA: alpha/beta hydrolase, partial [Aggregatilineales bacterium]|nr:alpha/beta hydrolase [Aggregatilineales bacterium]